MTGRASFARAEPAYTLPAIDRLAPAPSPALLAARIELHSGQGDVVADLFGRGGWVARAAVDLQRRGISLESSPLTRMLAEVVLRPPDVRHLDAAFQGMAASPRGDSSLKVSIGDLFATHCATCARSLVVDDIVWSVEDLDGNPIDAPRAVARHYRCTVCRDQRGGSDQRQGPLDDEDLARASIDVGAEAMRTMLRGRFPDIAGAPALPDELLDLHTPRQLVGLGAILERIEGDLRSAPVLAALRLTLLHAILPASRLATHPGRAAALRVGGGHVRPPTATQWRERNPWLAFEDAFRSVRGFIQRLDGGSLGPVQARLGEDLRSLGEGTATAVLGLSGPSGLLSLRDDSTGYGRTTPTPRVRLVLGQPPMRPSLERLASAYHGTAWVLGREAAAVLPVDALASSSLRAPWSWQAASIGRALEAVEPVMARDGRVVQLVDGGAEAVVAAVLGGATAGYRILSARLADPDDDAAGIVELLPPGGLMPPGPRTRGNVGLEPVPGGAGDPDVVPGRGLFAPPERFDQRPFSAADAARTVTETTVEILRARGEPARYERVLGEVLVGLDRAGQLRRLAAATLPPEPAPAPEATASRESPDLAPDDAGHTTAHPGARGDPEILTNKVRGAEEPRQDRRELPPGAPAPVRRLASARDLSPDPVEGLLALIRDELTHPTQQRVVEIEPGRWWLTEREDREAAAVPLADRVEWAVFSLLSTAGPISEAAFYERIASLFTGHDLPDEGLVRACLDSYRSLASTPDGLITGDDLLRRSQEHTELLGQLADAGHRLGMRVWIGRSEQSRRTAGGLLADRLDAREQRVYLGGISRAGDALAEVDAIWYVRSKVALLFEVEWTAMLGEPILRRHGRIPPDESIIRFLVIAPERAELVRYKLERSPLLRAALDEGTWHIIKSDHLRTFLARDPLDLADLEPYLGLDPLIERTGEQLPLFGG
ncbi:MAG TPA: hypothetical protein VF494_06035 [Candidatus Limnocylindrales bacterium]